MSRSKKDGKHGGGHRETQGREIWSKRLRKVSMWNIGTRLMRTIKRLTHRFERRQGRKLIDDIEAKSMDDGDVSLRADEPY